MNLKIKSLLFILLIGHCEFIHGYTVRTASLVQFRSYVINVVTQTMQEVEDYQWCNLKIPDITQDVIYEFFGRRVAGDVSYRNGYVVRIQHVDIVQSTVQEVWTWDRLYDRGTVDLRAQLRLHNVVLGYDVIANLDGTPHRYTSTFTYPLISYNFSILKNTETNQITVTVTGVSPGNPTRISYMPNDIYSDLLGTSFVPADVIPGIMAWGTDVIQPRTLDIVLNKIDFPEACYNC